MTNFPEYRVRELGMAADSLNTIGTILWRRHMSADLDELSKGDIEGLSLAVVSIAGLINEIVEVFDEALKAEAEQ